MWPHDGAFWVQFSHTHSMNLLLLGLLLLCCCGRAVRAAFEDFVVTADTEQQQEQSLALSCQAPDGGQEEELDDILAMQQDQVDAQQLLATLLQQAQRLGINLEQLMQMHAAEHMEPFDGLDEGCSAGVQESQLSYGQQASWYDVFFN